MGFRPICIEVSLNFLKPFVAILVDNLAFFQYFLVVKVQNMFEPGRVPRYKASVNRCLILVNYVHLPPGCDCIRFRALILFERPVCR